MAPEVIHAQSAPLEPEDLRKRRSVAKLLQSENTRLVDVAKHLVTMSFSAVGVVLALQDKWLEASAPAWLKSSLGAAVVLYLAAGVLTTLAAGAYAHRLSMSDYDNVDAELHRVATIRYRLTKTGLAFIMLATLIVSVVAIYG